MAEGVDVLAEVELFEEEDEELLPFWAFWKLKNVVLKRDWMKCVSKCVSNVRLKRVANRHVGTRKEDCSHKRNRLLCSCIAFACMSKLPLLSCHLEIQFAFSLGDDIVELHPLN